MTHDPYQTNPGWGAYPGITPFGLPYTAMQNPALQNPFQTQSMNPFSFQGAGIPQLGQQGYPGIQGYGMQGQTGFPGIHPQQLQLAALLASQINPQLAGQQHHIGLQNPLLAAWLQNPTQNPLLNPALAQSGIFGLHQQSPFQQSPYQQSLFQQSPYQQSPFQQSPYQQSPYQQSPFQQSPFQQSPFQQFGQLGQFGQQLPPQTWLGQALGQGLYGGGNPFAGRGFHTPGISPWAGY